MYNVISKKTNSKKYLLTFTLDDIYEDLFPICSCISSPAKGQNLSPKLLYVWDISRTALKNTNPRSASPCSGSSRKPKSNDIIWWKKMKIVAWFITSLSSNYSPWIQHNSCILTFWNCLRPTWAWKSTSLQPTTHQATKLDTRGSSKTQTIVCSW